MCYIWTQPSGISTLSFIRKPEHFGKQYRNLSEEIEIMKASEVFERTWEIFSNLENTGLSFVDEGGGGCGWVLSDDQEDLRI